MIKHQETPIKMDSKMELLKYAALGILVGLTPILLVMFVAFLTSLHPVVGLSIMCACIGGSMGGVYYYLQGAEE